MTTHTKSSNIFSDRADNLSTNLLSLLKVTLLYFCPVFLYCSCSVTEPDGRQEMLKGVRMVVAGNMNKGQAAAEDYQGKEYTADIFVYEIFGNRNLDSYQRLDFRLADTLDIACRTGNKEVFIVVNPQWDVYEWDKISCIDGLAGLYAELQKDDERKPLMIGRSRIDTKDGKTKEMAVSPIMSAVELRSLKCDFSSQGYREEALTDVFCWLANANSMVSVTSEDYSHPIAPLNTDGYPEEIQMSRPSMLQTEICKSIKRETIYPGVALYCYPNETKSGNEDGMFTRFVISGKIKGQRYYYPIDISTNGGIGRNCRYILDVTITKAGAVTPSLPVSSDGISLECEIVPWEENGRTDIPF